MAIGFGRVEFIKRSENRNSCQLSAYLSRSQVYFEGNCVLDPKFYDFSNREKVSFEEILLPEGVDENFKVAEVLWNAAEKKEVRKDAQVSMHLVLALPDEKELTREDRIELAKGFVQKHYVDKGLGAQLVVHPPEREIEFTEDNEALGVKRGTVGTVLEEKEGNYIVALPKGVRDIPFVEIGVKCPGISIHEHNWHAHAQLTTRRFKENGKEFEDLKATDLMPVIKKGKVVSGLDVGKVWAEHQNAFFLSKGLALKVDHNGLVPQEHLGPVRMRGRAFSLLEEHERRLALNSIEASDPKNILDEITKRQSVFTKDDVERFILKHTPGNKVAEVQEGFWKLDELVQLKSKETKEFVSLFTSEKVFQEERQILRLADRIHEKSPKVVPKVMREGFEKGLLGEQLRAYHNVLDGQGIACIQGYAGTGKSYLLKALRDSYAEIGLTVRAFGPENATAAVLEEKGLSNSENIYRFLFGVKKGKRAVSNGTEVWVVDEAGKLGNRPLLELLKLAEKKSAKVIFSGDAAQFSPVERGGVFKSFCERYGSEVLEDIQRQKNIADRSMSKDLAMGKTGEALDKLVNSQSIQWSLTKKESLESLVLKWADDHRAKVNGVSQGTDSSLIIAATNHEVRALNEMVRLVRKGRGEIAEKEFACATAYGTIFVSAGDRIEFRKNDRDLRVTNGMAGVLMKAEENRFSVAIQENGKKTRIISFNPKEYHSFQLGYATTCSRAQGRTVKKAYFLHSDFLNKQMAYVALTRHTDEVNYFVSKEDTFCLSDLKRKAMRDSLKPNTLDYTSSFEMGNKEVRKQKAEEIQMLKKADRLSDRMKGHTLGTLNHFKERIGDFVGKRSDRKLDSEFFNFSRDVESTKMAEVRQVSEEELKELSVVQTEAAEKICTQEVVQKVALRDETLAKNEDLVKIDLMKKGIEKEVYGEVSGSSNLEKSGKGAITWKDLPKEKRALISVYYDAATKSNEFKEIVQVELSGDLKNATDCEHYKEWQKSCAQRNEAAYRLKSGLTKHEFKEVLAKKSAYYVGIHAEKHQKILNAQEERARQAEKMQDLSGKLVNQIEPLLSRLFPDGPSMKSSRGYRFGAKGSLTVSHSGPKAGQFYDFERSEGGGLLKLIEREMGLDKKEAKEWALEFLGEAPNIKIPETFAKPKNARIDEPSNWISMKPDPKCPAPQLKEVGKIHHYFKEVTRHPYHDKDGNLLYYVLRLENGKGQKMTPPLSYGKSTESDAQPRWDLRGYKDGSGKNALYNQHLLKEKPLATVLVVEGEKTADKALEKFPDRDMVCITWLGGAKNVSKADWSPLIGKEVIVWPDNDKAGFEAANSVCDELKKVCASKICMVERQELFSKLPEKWDLADVLPEGVDHSSLSFQLMDNRKDRLQMEVFEKLKLGKVAITEKLTVSNLLFHFEKRTQGKMHDALQRNIHLSKKDELWHLYAAEGSDLIEKKKAIYGMVISNPNINVSGKLAERLTYQIHLYEAKYGVSPTESQVLLMKETIQNHTKNLDFIKDDSVSEDIKDLSINRALEVTCEKAIKGHKIKSNGFESEVQRGISEISNQKEFEFARSHMLEKQQSLGKDISRGLSL